MRKYIQKFLSSDKLFVTVTAFASGFYPLMHYYNSNFLMVNSRQQLIWFCSIFIMLPILVFNLLLFLIKRFSFLCKVEKDILIFLNFFTFSNLLLFVTYGFNKKYVFGICFLAMLLAFILSKFHKRLILIQLLLGCMTLIIFLPKLYNYYSFSEKWTILPDNIDKVVLKETPNIYVIQPDGYANFPEMEQPPYNYDNLEFKTFLETNSFEIYEENRSNYFSTLTSNASMFAMKHHYYMQEEGANETQYDYRKGLAGNNKVVKILKNNGYKTFMLFDFPYMIINRPNKEVDFINYNYSKMSHIGNNWKGRSLLDTLGHLIMNNKATHNFFFIEKLGYILRYD